MNAKYDMRQAWNRSSASYQERQRIPTHSVYYGPFAPLENELNLLGDVRSLRILDVGCGGGQACIAFAEQGAEVIGLDLSDMQLQFARSLAELKGADVRFVRGNGEDLSEFGDATLDMVFSCYVFHYVEDISRCLGECFRVLKPGGRLVISLDHPAFDCFFDEEDAEMSVTPVLSYFDNRRLSWPFPRTDVLMTARRYTISQWFDMLTSAGLRLERLCEPQVPRESLDSMWPEDGPQAPLRYLAHTIIFIARKPED